KKQSLLLYLTAETVSCRRSFSRLHLTTASQPLPGDEIATSRGIFMPHFAKVPAYVEVKEYCVLLSQRRDMPNLP
ncbi:MAG: hypothetical protein U2P59_00970, partial [Synergistota bacterium]|nr:hypothetical protein [Synergistota bacterium]